MSQIIIHTFARGARGVRVAAWKCEEMGLDYRCETVTYPPRSPLSTAWGREA